MEENKRKSDWKTLVIVTMAVLLVIQWAQINKNTEQIEELSNRLSRRESEISSLQTEIDSIYANVDEQLKKEASLLSGSEYTIGELNTDKTAVAATFSVVPKVVSDDIKLTLTVGANSVELIKNENAFKGVLDVGLFIESETKPLLTIETAEGTKTEYLEDMDFSYLYAAYLPSITVNSVTGTYKRDALNVDFHFYIATGDDSNANFTSFTLIEEVDGEEISRKDVTNSLKESGDNYYVQYSQSFQVSQGDELKVYLVAEDSLGYTHKLNAYYWYEREDGATAENVQVDGASIYDKDGNLLCGGKY